MRVAQSLRNHLLVSDRADTQSEGDHGMLVAKETAEETIMDTAAAGPLDAPAPQPPRVGLPVLIKGLMKSPEHNGKVGKIMLHDANTGRYGIDLNLAGEKGQSILRIKPANFEILRPPNRADEASQMQRRTMMERWKSQGRTHDEAFRHLRRLDQELFGSG